MRRRCWGDRLIQPASDASPDTSAASPLRLSPLAVQAPPKEDWILVIDPDMIVRASAPEIAQWGRVYGAARGLAVSVHFG